MSSSSRAINRIAAEISTVWREVPPPLRVKKVASAYLEALLNIRSCKDTYGLDTGHDVVRRFLVQTSQWHGADARRLKDELKNHLEAGRVHH